MSDGAVGRLLVASLHQGIADLLPSRLDFYESWLNPVGLRDGRIGIAPLAAVLSFLRQEGEPYHQITARAGEYTAEWTVANLPAIRRTIIRASPPGLRLRLVMRVARMMVRNTYRDSRVLVRWRNGTGAVEIRGSIFCEVRERTPQRLCEFYVSAVRRLMYLFSLEVDVGAGQCRATTGAEQCMMSVLVKPVATAAG
jgi:hypothetical protein